MEAYILLVLLYEADGKRSRPASPPFMLVLPHCSSPLIRTYTDKRMERAKNQTSWSPAYDKGMLVMFRQLVGQVREDRENNPDFIESFTLQDEDQGGDQENEVAYAAAAIYGPPQFRSHGRWWV